MRLARSGPHCLPSIGTAFSHAESSNAIGGPIARVAAGINIVGNARPGEADWAQTGFASLTRHVGSVRMVCVAAVGVVSSSAAVRPGAWRMIRPQNIASPFLRLPS